MSKITEGNPLQIKQCPKCKEDIQERAKKCKHCGADLRNWFSRHKILTAFMGFFLLLIIISSDNDKKMSQIKKANDETSARIERTEKLIDKKISNDQKEVAVHGADEDVMIDDLKIKVVRIKDLGSSISRSFGEPIKTQGKFIRIDFEVENMGNEAQYMGDMKVIDSKDREFSESDEKYSILGDDANFLDKLNPNIKTNYSTVFDVAPDAENLKLKTNGFGLFNTNYVLIDLEV